MPFKPGNGAGFRKLSLSEDDLRRLILLPAVRQFHLFLRRFREGASLREIASESGRTLASTQAMLNRAARTLGVKKLPSRPEPHPETGWFREIGDGDSERVHLSGQLAVRRHYEFDADLAEDYFVSPALRMFEVARLYFVQRKSEPELLRSGVALRELQNLQKYVPRWYRYPQHHHVYHLRRSHLGSSACGNCGCPGDSQAGR